MSDWQPMDTAPKDGTEFLGYSSRVGKCDVFRWSAHWELFETTQHDGTYGPDVDEIDIFDDITHWMPLPPPPGVPAILVQTVREPNADELEWAKAKAEALGLITPQGER